MGGLFQVFISKIPDGYGMAVNLKLTFLLDLLAISSQDESMDDKEKKLYVKFGQILGVKEAELNQLTNLVELIKNGDVSSIYRCSLQRDAISKDLYKHLLQMKDIQLEDYDRQYRQEIAKILKFELSEVKMDYGRIDNKMVATSCVSNQQFCCFLQWLFDRGQVRVSDENRVIFTENDTLYMDLSMNRSICFIDGVFSAKNNNQ